jgi:hypothetical protein
MFNKTKLAVAAAVFTGIAALGVGSAAQAAPRSVGDHVARIFDRDVDRVMNRDAARVLDATGDLVNETGGLINQAGQAFNRALNPR